eukprot:CAMPEP_0114341580 /NCGR_PEP_ID=MMETSP0101-20121206/9144_1 /TAXON_ID=38822 ORGANISM="Pteridomonas danica, Strain PT" /NCGR_SAMPLE_ID=MMETSP0101 /ASSEMBLY_ACC=CAM_ASM_000211 /LENGTH=473 /DNA_ID=CAMNT_0001475235 /DNA_START=147 /DNA_END=1568 /DNA_ORIENTATION=-
MAPRNQSGGLLRYVVIGGVLSIGILLFLLDVVAKLHSSSETSMSQPHLAGAPVLAAPGVSPQSPSLRRAAKLREMITIDEILGSEWSGMKNSGEDRTSGPFPNLGGSVSKVKFTYPEIIPEVDLKTYPPVESLLDIIHRWNPDESDNIPNPFHEKLQMFNYSDLEQRKMAEKYRNAELPFKIFGIPEIENVVEKWNDEYLEKKLHSPAVNFKVEKSTDNHFMYNVRRNYKGNLGEWQPPTKDAKGMDFNEWVEKAHKGDTEGIDPDEPHFYLTTGVQAGRLVAANKRLKQFISSDLGVFSTTKNNFFITAVDANKGIQCRFGMKGVIAEAHYDGGRNMVAMLKGAKRYILTPPSECKKLSLIKDKQHPSYRHSVTDWSNPEEASEDGFHDAMAIDTILHEGEVLYIPSYWIHYIASLDYSIQCNSRSGSPPNQEGGDHIHKCMSGPNSEKDIKVVKRYMSRERKSFADSAAKS